MDFIEEEIVYIRKLFYENKHNLKKDIFALLYGTKRDLNLELSYWTSSNYSVCKAFQNCTCKFRYSWKHLYKEL
jgi:hypothetical protein